MRVPIFLEKHQATPLGYVWAADRLVMDAVADGVCWPTIVRSVAPLYSRIAGFAVSLAKGDGADASGIFMSEASVYQEAVGVNSARGSPDDELAALIRFIDSCRDLVYSVRGGPPLGSKAQPKQRGLARVHQEPEYRRGFGFAAA